ncbi:hypothetical protein EGI26_13780 [Lacihabitans sp. CCS-44]|nr:hypothetical protein [Lacihabitans sp. CCS-44]
MICHITTGKIQVLFTYFVSAAAWAFIFFRKKTKQKKPHGCGRPSTNSHTQNSFPQLIRIKISVKEF